MEIKYRQFALVIVVIILFTGCITPVIEETLDKPQTNSNIQNTQTSDKSATTTTDTQTHSSQPPNPWKKSTIKVAVQNEQEPPFNSTELTQQALEYWEINAPQYTDYTVKYTIVPVSNDHDIRVTFKESVTQCRLHDEDIIGCADYPDLNPPDVTNVEVQINDETRIVVATLKHEIGHTLNLRHGDDPKLVMNETVQVVDNQSERVTIAEQYNDAIESYNNAINAYSRGIQAYNNENYDSSATHFSTAEQRLQSTQKQLESVRANASQHGFTNATKRIDESIRYLEIFIEMSNYLKKSSQSNTYENRVKYYEKASESEEKLDNQHLASSEELAISLKIDFLWE